MRLLYRVLNLFYIFLGLGFNLNCFKKFVKLFILLCSETVEMTSNLNVS